MEAYWRSLAAKGDPNADGGLDSEWKALSGADDDAQIHFVAGSDYDMESGRSSEFCDFWDKNSEFSG